MRKKKLPRAVKPDQRFTRKNPCPVCSGGDDDERGSATRCSGFLSTDERFAFCTREEPAGDLDANNAEPPAYRHVLDGPCACGERHDGDESNTAAKTSPTPKPKKPAATYDYEDESGELLFQVVRLDPKGFCQRAADGTWSTKGVRRVLYKLPALLAAEIARTVYIPEGEKDVLSLTKAGHLATCNPGGAGKWKHVAADAAKALAGRDVIVIADHDTPGHKHAHEIARSLTGHAKSVQLVQAPAPHKDVTDLLEAGGTLEDLVPLTDEDEDEDDEDDTKDEKPPKQADVLVQLARAHCTFFHDANDTAYARTRDGAVLCIRSMRFRALLDSLYFDTKKSSAGGAAKGDALATLAGIALHSSPRSAVFVRVAGHEGKVYLDLANDAHEVIELDSTGWRITTACPVHFLRPKALLPLCRPRPGGDADDLYEFLNVSTSDFVLVVAWLVAALRPRGPYPILVLQGRQGAAKSTTARVLRALTDPSTAPIRTPPRDPGDLAIAANNAHVIALDNMSGVTEWLSDALCRVSTGGGFAKRALYTDAEEQIFDFQRPICLNGIDDLLARPDLADRALVVTLPEIPHAKRKDEKSLWAAFDLKAPGILGALLDGVVRALRDEPTLRLDSVPRMADFVRWASAALPELGIGRAALVTAMARSKAEATTAALDADPLAHRVREILDGRDIWEGSATMLLKLVHADADRDEMRELPRAANTLTNRLRRLAPALREVGVLVSEHREGHDRQRVIQLTRVALPPAKEEVRKVSSAPSASSDAAKNKPASADGLPSLHRPQDRPHRPPSEPALPADGPPVATVRNRPQDRPPPVGGNAEAFPASATRADDADDADAVPLPSTATGPDGHRFDIPYAMLSDFQRVLVDAGGSLAVDTMRVTDIPNKLVNDAAEAAQGAA